MRIRLSRKIASSSNASCYGWLKFENSHIVIEAGLADAALFAVSGLLQGNGKVWFNGPSSDEE